MINMQPGVSAICSTGTGVRLTVIYFLVRADLRVKAVG